MNALGCGFAAVVAAAALAAGCSDDGGSGASPTATAQPAPPPVAAPKPAVPAGWEGALHRAAVSLFTTQSFCSGTWISAHAVLTAAHCVEELDPTTFFVVPQANANDPGAKKLKTGGFYIHPSYLAARKLPPGTMLASQLAADFAVVSVPVGMPEGAKPVLLDFEHTVQKQRPYKVAGYGHTGKKDGVAAGGGILRNGELKALYKFANKDVVPKAGAGHYWVLDGETRVEVCQGDSGGPAFWVSGDDIMQFGVNSYILSGTASDLAEIQRLSEKAEKKDLWSPEELTFYGRFLDASKNVSERGCSRLVSVAAVGEMRDWIKARSEEIEHDAGAR